MRQSWKRTLSLCSTTITCPSRKRGGMSKYLNNIRTANAYLDIKEGVYNTLKEIPKGDKVVEGIRKAKKSFKQLVVPGMFLKIWGSHI